MTIRPVGQQSFSMRTDGCTNGQPDMTKLIIAFRNFAKAPKKKRMESSPLCLRANISTRKPVTNFYKTSYPRERYAIAKSHHRRTI